MSLDLPSLLSSGLSFFFFFFSMRWQTQTCHMDFEKRDQLCNGHAPLCDRKYGNVTFLGAHDSFAASGNPFARKEFFSLSLRLLGNLFFSPFLTICAITVARTQEVDVNAQLTMGVRLLQAQAHMCVPNILFFSFMGSSYIYLIGIAKTFISATLVSFLRKPIVVAKLTPFLVRYYLSSLRKSFFILFYCYQFGLFYLFIYHAKLNRVSSMVAKWRITSRKSRTSSTDIQTKSSLWSLPTLKKCRLLTFGNPFSKVAVSFKLFPNLRKKKKKGFSEMKKY